MAIQKPSLDHYTTIPHLLQFHYEHNPEQPIYIYAEDGQDIDNGLTEIKYLEFIRASHRAAHLIRPRRSGQDREVVAIIALADTIVYTALVVGVIHSGLIPLLISPRNTAAAVINLLKKTGAHRILGTQTTLQELFRDIKVELASPGEPIYDVTFDEIPGLNMLYPKIGAETEEDPFVAYPSASNYPSLDESAVILHSSGSTGMPKPIPLNHLCVIKSWAQAATMTQFRDYCIGSMSLPGFHAMGFWLQIVAPLYAGNSIATFPPVVKSPQMLPIQATPDTTIEHLRRTRSACIAVPTMFAVWVQSSSDMDVLRSLSLVIGGGGPMPTATGDYLVEQGVRFHACYGGTEVGLPVSSTEREYVDWQWHKFIDSPHIRWVPQGDGTSELQCLNTDSYVVAVDNLPDASGYATSDLWKPHPTKPGLWTIVGRIDDVIVHSSGEKTVPGPIEAIISSSPMLHGALMFGRQRDQPGILLEPSAAYQVDANDSAQIHKFRNLIWPIVEEANKASPAYSRLFKEMILVVDHNKPLPRVGKGTVAGKAALALYDAEIEKLYETIATNSGGDSVELPESWTAADLQLWLVSQISDIISSEAPAITADLFEHGFDSLSATILRLRLVGALRKSGMATLATTIPQGMIYSYPTIRALADVFAQLVANPDEESSTLNVSKTHEEAIEEMISKYSQGLDASLSSPVPVDTTQHYVLLTGSTGNLGAQLLHSLLLNDCVTRVYALNRPSNKASMYERHHARFVDKALDVALLSSPKLVFLAGETSREKLGLDEDTLTELHQNLTMVIHNAWRLDFNLKLASFESHVKGSRALIDLARSSRHSSSIRFLFTSSIGSTQSWDAKIQGSYPEEVVMDAKYAVGGGYGESKYVTERILAKSGLEATSFRLGQLAGGTSNGAWATSDWVPIFVKSSLTIGMLPDAFGAASWMPMDAVSDALLDVGFSREPIPIAVNVVHPNPVSWNFVIEIIRSALIQEKNLPSDALPLVPYHEWVDTVERLAKNFTESEIPAIKLFHFYRSQSNADNAIRKHGQITFESAGLTPLQTSNIERLSERTRTLKPLDDTIVRKWVKYWIEAGF